MKSMISELSEFRREVPCTQRVNRRALLDVRLNCGRSRENMGQTAAAARSGHGDRRALAEEPGRLSGQPDLQRRAKAVPEVLSSHFYGTGAAPRSRIRTSDCRG
jgi:hypothetical protein